MIALHRRLALRAFGATALAALLPSVNGCSTIAPVKRWQSLLLRDHPLAGKIWHVAAERFVAFAYLAESVRNAHFRLLGEVHDNADHHVIQAKLLDFLGAGGLKPLVAFEQFDREFDRALLEKQTAGTISADDVADAVKFDRKGWNWEFYRPLVEIALRYTMPLRAANLSRTAAVRIAKQGLAALDPARVAALRLETAWSAEKEQGLRDTIIDGHCGALPASMVPAMTAAQRARDATLAQALSDGGRDGAVLITGNGHVRRDLGVPVYLEDAADARTICAVGILEVDAESSAPRAYVKSAMAGVPLFDFVCFTPRWQRPDPCAAFKSEPAGRSGETGK